MLILIRIPAIFIKKCELGLTSPLKIIFQRSLDEGTFPRQWREAQIVPIHKKGSKLDVSNYRGVSLLNNFGKMLEKIVYGHIYAATKLCIPASQHGFVKSRSVNTNLLELTNYIVNVMKDGAQVDVIYTDFEKAFDRVDFGILIEKLKAVGIKGNLLRWIDSYLRNRRQAVVIGSYRSDYVDVTSGVPQGSLVSPLLYNIYLFDITQCFLHSEHLLYADDKKIFMKINNPSDCQLIQSDLDRLSDYYNLNNINVNTTKCQVITFSKKRKNINYKYRICNDIIPRASQVRDLGVILDEKLTFEAHINQITSKAYKSLGFVIRNSQLFKSPLCLKTLYYCYVRSILESASVIWRPFYKKYINQIEAIQRKFIKHLNYKTKVVIPNYQDSCRYHKFSTLEERRQLNDMMLLYDILNNKFDCPQLLSKIHYNVPLRRTRHTTLLSVPTASTNYLKMSPFLRLPALFNDRFPSMDPFNTTRSRFKKEIIQTLHQTPATQLTK